MASLTVRQLDDKLKKLLRLRAARHGRSMEDEVRVILRQSAEQAGGEILERFEPPAQPMRPTSRVSAADAKRMRGERPFVFSNLRSGDGVDAIIEFIRTQGLLDHQR